MNRKYGTKISPALLVLYFQLNVRAWFEECWVYDIPGTAAPSLVSGLQSYSRANRFDWLPHYDDIPIMMSLDTATQPNPGTGGAAHRNTSAGDRAANPGAQPFSEW